MRTMTDDRTEGVREVSRRQLGERLAVLATLVASGASAGQVMAQTTPSASHGQPASPAEPAHDMNAMPAHWMGKEQIAFLIYPDFTALDMVGPHYMLTNLMGATTHIVAKTRDPIRSDTGLVFLPSATFEECPLDLDIICVPGGTSGTLAAMQDIATLRFLKDRGSRAKFVTSVCTGSLVLGAAGLLDGYRATSHWLTTSVLPIFGAIPTAGRVVRDRNRITGGGVTAGIDFGLGLVGELRDRTYAEAVQLLAEYAPEPPFQAGSPETAPAPAKQILDAMFVNFLADTKTRAGAVRARWPEL
jgi:putative intracellular protease/amidase